MNLIELKNQNKMKRILTLSLLLLLAVACSKKEAVEPIVRIETSMGDIKIKLYNETPLHRDNFLQLVDSGFYEGILFHRVIADFIAQAGDPDSKTAEPGQLLGEHDAGYSIPAEFVPTIYHKRGAVNAAREGNEVNPEKRSSSSQFCLFQGHKYTREELDAAVESANNTRRKDNPLTLNEEQIELYTTIGGAPHLDGEYTVFGEVIEGQDIVDAIATVETDIYDRPLEDVVIIRMVREN